MHNTLAKWGKQEMDSGKRIVQKDQLELFTEKNSVIPALPAGRHSPLSIIHLIDLWHQSFIVEGYASKTDADAARKRGEIIMGYVYDWWSTEKRDVVAVEKGFLLEEAGETGETRETREAGDSSIASISSIPSIPFSITGRFDRIESIDGGLRVIDFKTSAVRSQEEVDTDLQLSIYALAAEQVFGLRCVELVLLFLREDGVTQLRTTRSAAELDAARGRITEAACGITERRFEPTPGRAVCSRCPYRGICDAAAV